MNFLILSDSHRRRENLLRALGRAGHADGILFLGDGLSDLPHGDSFEGIPIYAVRGNCDSFTFSDSDRYPEELLLRFGEYTVLMTHGHLFGVKASYERAAAHACARGADILLFGHTHIPLEKYLPAFSAPDTAALRRGIYIFNPGSIGEPRDGAPSFGTMEIRGKTVLFGHGSL